MTQVSWTRQLGLAAVLFVLGSAALWLEYSHRPKQEAAEEQAKHVFHLKEGNKDLSVQSMTLFDGKQSTVLNCTDMGSQLCKTGDQSKWEISEPSKLKADDANANALLSALSALSTTETIDLKSETEAKKTALLKEYGLDPENRKKSLQLSVKTPSQALTLFLGHLHPLGETQFAMESSNENQVYLIPISFKSNLDHNLTYWRDKKFLALNAHEIESMALESQGQSLSATKKEGQWTLHTQGTELSGDAENIDALLTTLSFLTAKDFTSESKKDDKAKAALKGLTLALKITLQKEKGTLPENPAPVSLSFFRKKPKDAEPNQKLFVTASHLDPLFELEGSTFDRLNKSTQDLRMSKLMTSMDRFSAKHLEFGGSPMGSTSIKLANQNGKWVKSSDPKIEVPSNKVQDILEKLSNSKIKNFLEGSQIPTGEKEGLTVTVGDEKEIRKRQWIFWKKDKKVYARNLLSKRKEVFLIDSTIENALPWTKEFFSAQPEAKPEMKIDTKTQ